MRRRFTSNRKTSGVGYCAITATQENTNIRCTYFEYIYYAINNISNWSRGHAYIFATLNTGDTVYLKSAGDEIFDIVCDKPVELSGSILSLVYGDNYSNETSLSHITQRIASFSNVVSVSSDFLPSKDLGRGCYYGMFQGCTGLIKAPELPATTLANDCYSFMFDDCTNLKYIKMLATDISAFNCLLGWVGNVSSTGIFVKSKDATWNVRGDDGIPNGWTVITEEEEGNVGSGGEITFYVNEVEFKALDGMTWQAYVDSDYNYTVKDVNHSSNWKFIIDEKNSIEGPSFYDEDMETYYQIYTGNFQMQISSEKIIANKQYYAD